jgi:hypothetical protein
MATEPLSKALNTNLGGTAYKQFMSSQKPILEQKEKLSTELAGTEQKILEGQQLQKETEAQGKVEAGEKYVQQRGEAQQMMQEKLAQKPIEAFIPTKDTAQDIAGLFGLIGVLGMLGGKGNAQRAMGAMNGMLEGHRKGRADLYKQERDTYDKNFKALLKEHEQIRSEFKDALETMAVDKELGVQKAQLAAVKSGSSILQEYVRKGEIVKAAQLADEMGKTVSKATELDIQERRHAQTIAAAKERAQTRMTVGKKQLMQGSDGKMYSFNPETNEFSPVALPAGVESMAKPGARAGQNALTFASRVYGNIENSAQDLKNIVSLPATAQLPVLSGLLNVEKDTALKSIESMAARKITNPENRAFQQVSDQLGAALSRMEAQGLASGATKANVASFNSLRPAAGDNAVNMAIYLARVKQEIETGIKVLDKMPGATTEQKEAVKVILQDLNTFVPYNVEDALDVLKKNNKQLGDKMTRLVSQPTVADNLNIGVNQQSTPTQPSTPSGPKEGEVSKSKSGRDIVFRNGAWEYQ